MNIERQPNMHDLSWFIDMHRQERLDLDPPYQRLSVWTSKDRFDFLDTIFNNFPCPAIYVQKDVTATGPVYNVVDGKQRLTTILSFFDDKIRLPRNFSLPRLAGRKFSQLHQDDVVTFYNYVFLVETLRATGEAGWAEVFHRVNKNQKTLTEQELRHARYDGWLITWAEAEAADGVGFWERFKIATRARTRRMKDVELISTFMLILLERDFVGFPQANIDALYAKYDFNPLDLPAHEAEGDEDLDGDRADGRSSEGGGVQIDPQGSVEIEGEPGNHDLTRTALEGMMREFEEIKDFVKRMEEQGGVVSRHSRRVTTDFYSLWSLLSLSDVRTRLGVEAVARGYDDLLGQVDALFDQTDGEPPVVDEQARRYHAASIGAATTAPMRRARHDALLAFLDGSEG